MKRRIKHAEEPCGGCVGGRDAILCDLGRAGLTGQGTFERELQ